MYWYVKLPIIGEVYAEFPSVTRGYQFFDTVKEEGERLFWIGRFHLIWTPISKVRELEQRLRERVWG